MALLAARSPELDTALRAAKQRTTGRHSIYGQLTVLTVRYDQPRYCAPFCTGLPQLADRGWPIWLQ